MYVDIDTTGHATLRDVGNLRELKVIAPAIADADVASALETAGWGQLDGEHAWLSIAALREAGTGQEAGWEAGFDDMIAYATSKDWLSADGLGVRAHLER
ncbi:hypothetical protein [Arthrobacter sp.]|uniref:hypothetical protein n=1 Tax=Arthrobacter sp. TaxID=1667 RepID=UPI003A928EBD